jgi:hypothetical protein
MVTLLRKKTPFVVEHDRRRVGLVALDLDAYFAQRSLNDSAIRQPQLDCPEPARVALARVLARRLMRSAGWGRVKPPEPADETEA